MSLPLLTSSWPAAPCVRAAIHTQLQEIGVSVFVVACGIIPFRLIVKRTPAFTEHPDYREAH